MFVNLVNNTSFDKIRVCCDGNEYFLGQRESVTVDVNRNFTLRIFTQEKNEAIVDFLGVFFDGFVGDEHICNAIYYDAEFDLEADDTDCIKTISIDSLEARDDNLRFVYFSVYLNSQNVRVLKAQYLPTDIKKQKRKSIFLLTCISSSLWVIIPIIILTSLGEALVSLLILFILFPLSTVPSFKKAFKLKSGFASETIIKALKKRSLNII